MFTIIRTLIILSFLVLTPILWAQDDMPAADYVIEGEFIVDFRWLPDGTGLRVINATLSGDQVLDFQYDLATQNTRPSDEQRVISRLDQLNNLDGKSPSPSGIVFMSPDQQWVVYGVTENENQYLAINHLAAEQEYILYEAQALSVYSLFTVRWSDDSSAFYVYSATEAYMYYVSHFAGSWEDMSVVQLNWCGCANIIDNSLGLVDAIFDLDAAGQTLLIRRFVYPEEGSAIAQLVALNMKTLNYEILVDQAQDLTAASFGSNGEIYYIDAQGMHVYEAQSEASRLLNAEINSSWIGKTEISPDGRYVAVLKGDGELNVIPVTPQ